MGDARLGTRMRRERLPVTCMFWLDRGLGKGRSQWPNTKTRSKPGQWLGVVRSPRSQGPVLNVGILDFLVLWYWTSCTKTLIKCSFFHFWEVSSIALLNLLLCFVTLYLLWKAVSYFWLFILYAVIVPWIQYILLMSLRVLICVFKFSSPVESVSFFGEGGSHSHLLP